MTTERLYKIEGGTEQEQKQICDAMDYLCSLESKSFGTSILKHAYKLHGKPVTISISNLHDNVYSDLTGENSIDITLSDFNGKTLTCHLAKELTHSAQEGYQDNSLKIIGINQKYYDQYIELAGSKKTEIPADDTKKMVDKVLLPMAKWIKKQLASDPVYLAYHDKYIKPALNNEKKVAELLGIKLPEQEIAGEITTSRKKIERNYNRNTKFGELIKKSRKNRQEEYIAH